MYFYLEGDSLQPPLRRALNSGGRAIRCRPDLFLLHPFIWPVHVIRFVARAIHSRH